MLLPAAVVAEAEGLPLLQLNMVLAEQVGRQTERLDLVAYVAQQQAANTL